MVWVWMWCGVLLSVFSLGLSAPVNSCDILLEPITVRHEDVSVLHCKLHLMPCNFNVLVRSTFGGEKKKSQPNLGGKKKVEMKQLCIADVGEVALRRREL